ncbi:hypothetical protein [Streptomyces sp. NBC_01565]|uniref:hypothetical protein n=1 Tax=unclassified Streptomyces TaxID=2593676 RepID=UPI0022571967|nr:hypothetical protein [Streptomyces sp. NBC_01565]MCX4546405.1 hypothetical protein [Streptomyces sp. NBC_01565]
MLISHRVGEDGVLLVGLLPGLGLRQRAAATLAVEGLLVAVRPSRVVIEPAEPVTPAAVSVILRTQLWCARNALPLSVEGSAALRRIVEDNLRQTAPEGPVVPARTPGSK